MNSRWLPPVIVFVLCYGGGADARGADSPKKNVSSRWLGDWEQGRKEARASGRPIFVVFRCEH
jgi:hypothetical protein